ncbi:TonB-dependent receptor [Aurantiacibacter poecillastricola]|uniref:TonB-dependent receptor n=1 Tax=Aurantiacibacter poecillastricola TaxID=3064385 RepID=UPI00273DE895|nr:TonB-dependent receptor [Aurantiacibacter sp. 219JJ12-13]MDP5260996.1 TonB-dependent receptor [Aurantiacibacter sp. 219JJ12-13]
MTARTHLALFTSSAALLAGLPAYAQDGDTALSTRQVTAVDIAAAEANPDDTNVVRDTETGNIIYVYGRGERRIGVAGAASEGGVAGADIEIRPLLRPGELLEATPGLIATQHSGGGKANQFFLRGFNLDHGTDYSVYIDDFPVNFRTHGHGQGYLDVNGLIPETVARVDYRKGPYRVDAGDFSLVGSSQITTHDRLRPFASAEIGSFGYRRLAAGGSAALGSGEVLVAGQAKFNDGPWELPEDFEGYSAFLKFTQPLGGGDLSLSYSLFDANWAPTEQIPERAVGSDICEDRFCSIDPTLRGDTQRHVLTAGYLSDGWRVTAYAQNYDWDLLSNFTYFLEDPVNGDQLRQYADLWTFGGRIEHTAQVTDRLSLRVGAEGRYDDIGEVGFDETIAGATEFTVGAFSVDEASLGLYAEAIWRPIDRLMVIGGLRGDWYRFETEALRGDLSWSGEKSDGTFASKVGVNYEVADGIAIYANYGEGFHSNDARGVTNPVDPVPGLVAGHFEELGVRFERGGLILTGVYWWSSIDSELIYVGDAGTVEPNDGSERHGYELTAFYKPNNWLALDAVWTDTTSRYVDVAPGQDRIPGALDTAGEVGASAAFPEWNAAARLRYLGPHPLVEDNSVRGDSTTLVNARIAWTPQDIALLDGWAVHAELLNVFDSKDDDIDYFYATRLPGEPLGGVEGVNSRIVEPRQLRVGLTRQF